LLKAAGVPAIACGNISPSALDALMDAQDAGQLPQSGLLNCPASSWKRRIT
jgi:UDP-N-acetylmuramoylalanine--D-glutamate ligase